MDKKGFECTMKDCYYRNNCRETEFTEGVSTSLKAIITTHNGVDVCQSYLDEIKHRHKKGLRN